MMTPAVFQQYLQEHQSSILAIRKAAFDVHLKVNQTYDSIYPYAYHLEQVALSVRNYGHLVCADADDLLPLFFGAYFHDSIEDARLTYNDVKKTALQFMDEKQAFMAAEIVYALTNDKGRTRSERAGEHYYQGIRETPYAPFVKLADRLANTSHSFSNTNAANLHMREVYRREFPHFLQSITVQSSDPRFCLPQTMIDTVLDCMNQ